MKRIGIVFIGLMLWGCSQVKKDGEQKRELSSAKETILSKKISKIDGLVTFWDFSNDTPLLGRGKEKYRLRKANKLVSVDKITNVKCINIKEGGYLYIPRKECPALNFHGENSKFTIVAKLNRKEKSYEQCEAIAGMWNETEKKRQYFLFLNLLQKESEDQVCGHVSNVGGPTPGHKWARDASIGKTPVDYGEWVTVAFSFDGSYVKSYLNGELDVREGLNPYKFNYELFDGGEDGSDFTVGAVDRLGEMGNYFVGGISQLAVFNRALSEKEIEKITTKLNNMQVCCCEQ